MLHAPSLAAAVVAAAVGMLVARTGQTPAVLVGVLLGVAASATVARHQLASRLRQAESRILQSERRARAEWLHDTVCAELRRARLRLAEPSASRDDLAAMLGELEHRIRLAHLETSMHVGRVRISEVVQPFLRLLQDTGVTVLGAPCFGEAGAEVEAPVAARLQHALSVLVNNAVLAGARGVSLHVRMVGECVEVEVVDDAGGFDLASVPAGRALDSLAHEVGVENLDARCVDGKTVVRVLMPADLAA